MKVLALNGSPRMKASSTHQLLTALLEGMQAAGAETELVELRKLDLQQCIGCYSCWVRTPGRCIHADAMDAFLPERFCQADMVVFGTPLYHFNMTGTMKVFIDRTLPRAEPWLVPHRYYGQLTTHPERWPAPKRMFLVSSCGFPEYEHFDALVRTFKQLARTESIEYAGELLRPAAEPLSQKALLPLFGEYLALVQRAGEELVRAGYVSNALQQKLRVDLPQADKPAFYQVAARYWTQKMDRFRLPLVERRVAPVLPHELDDDAAQNMPAFSGIASPSQTPETLARAMAASYNAAGLPGLRCTLQLHISAPAIAPPQSAGAIPLSAPPQSAGAIPLSDRPLESDWFLHVDDAECTAHPGMTPFPTLRIHTPIAIWQAIGRGQLDPEQAFTEGRYEAEGSMELLKLLPRLFIYPQAA